MSFADYDKTLDPDERELCDEHPNQYRPCPICRAQARIDLFEALKDE